MGCIVGPPLPTGLIASTGAYATNFVGLVSVKLTSAAVFFTRYDNTPAKRAGRYAQGA